MQLISTRGLKEVSGSTEYNSSWEHIEDELIRLDLMLHLYILSQNTYHPEDLLDQLKGLVISEEEITGILEERLLSASDKRKVEELSEQLETLEVRIEKKRAETVKKGIPLTLHTLSEIFNLTSMEEQCIIICLALELDTKYEKLYAYIQDDVTKKKPTVDMILKLLCSSFEDRLSSRLMFHREAPLPQYLLHIDGYSTDNGMPLISHSINLQERIVNYILGFKSIDAKIADFTNLVYPGEETGSNLLDENKLKFLERIERYIPRMKQEQRNVVFHIYGPWGSGKKFLAETACKTLELPLVTADLSKLKADTLSYEEALSRLIREALLQKAALCVENIDCFIDEENKIGMKLKDFIEIVNRNIPLAFILSSKKLQYEGIMGEGDYIDIELGVPDGHLRKKLWSCFIEGSGIKLHDIDEIAEKFIFTPGQIRNAVKAAARRAVFDNERIDISAEELHRSCRDQSNKELGKLSQRIEPKQSISDIVLPEDRMEQLREIIEYVKHKTVVYEKWGFENKLSKGKGLNILFSGPPGTGKTMAAEVIAKELLLELYKIDLSQVVNKYIGETEKNLSRIFNEAKASNAILFFDEADALFGKRSEVKDAHDRYANIETAYLLQKMEEYEGITILATNLRGNMDEAFTRRIGLLVDFPFPDKEYREELWKSFFPKKAPLGEDVDMGFLASRFKIPGGNIRNVALTAAFYAAGDAGPIKMEHIIKAIKREYQKTGRICVKSDFGDYYDIVK